MQMLDLFEQDVVRLEHLELILDELAERRAIVFRRGLQRLVLRTRVAHSQSAVELSPRADIPLKDYVKDAQKYVAAPANAVKRRSGRASPARAASAR